MELTIKKFDDNDFVLSGSVVMYDGETYVMDDYKGRMTYFDFHIPILKVESVKIWYPFGCDFLMFYLMNDRIIHSTSPIPFIFRALYKIGYFDKIGGVGIYSGRRQWYPEDRERLMRGFIVEVPVCWYGFNAQIWIDVPYENLLEYDFDMVEKADLPEWFRRKYIPVTKRKKTLSENEKLDLLMRLMPKDK